MGTGPAVSQTIDKQALLDLLAPPIAALGYELVDLEARTGRNGLLRIYIDKPSGVTVGDCELVSQQVGALLDVEDPLPGRYVLEVSSPGLDRRLRTIEHFDRFKDETVRIELKSPRDGRRRLKGRIVGADEDMISIDVDGTTWNIGLGEIAIARLVPEGDAPRVTKR